MIITSLALEGVGRFRSRHVVQGLGNGLNLLCAPNEAGKSTLFRALHVGLFSRFGSSGEDVRMLACLGAQLPVKIDIGFELGGAAYLVSKSFLRDQGCVLQRNNVVVAEGRAADEQTWSILGVAAAARGADESTFGLLWVRQGTSFDALQPSESARLALNRLIEAEVGQVLGGERAERIHEQLSAELSREQTDSGRARSGGKWKEALERVDLAKGSLAELSATVQALDAELTALAKALDRQRELQDPTSISKMRADHEAATQQQASIEHIVQSAELAEADVARLKSELELAENKHHEIIELDERIENSRTHIADVNERLMSAEAAHRRHAETVTELDIKFTHLTDQLNTAEQECDRIAKLSLAIGAVGRARDLEARLERARTLRELIAAIDASLSERYLPAATLTNLEEQAQELASLEARLEAKAPHLTMTLGPSAGRRVSMQGQVVDTPVTSAVLTATRIDVEQIVSIDIVPASSTADAEVVERARSQLQSKFHDLNVSSLSEVRRRRSRIEAFEAERRGLAAELASVAPAERGEDGVQNLELALGAVRANLIQISAEDGARLPTHDEISAQRVEAERHRDQVRRQCNEAQTALIAARGALSGDSAVVSGLRVETRMFEAKLREDLASCPDDQRDSKIQALKAALAEASRKFTTARANADDLRSRVPAKEQRSALNARMARLARALEAHTEQVQEVERTIAELRGRVATRGGEGLGERRAACEEELTLSERDLARVESRLAGIRLLHDTLDACRKEAQDAYLAPIKTAMKPYLYSLFPDADALLDENLEIEALERSGMEPLPFEYLSHGTREQIAVIVRLALGRLLASRCTPVPVLLDDALVFSDDERIERMFDALTQAGQQHQVIVLTCRDRVFQSLGARRLSIESA